LKQSITGLLSKRPAGQRMLSALWWLGWQKVLPARGIVMRQILILAIVLLGVGGYAAQFADKVMEAKPAAPALAAHADNGPAPPVTSGRSLMLEADRRGHFQVAARIGGRPIDFLVDTGASTVALRESDAAQIGVRPMLRDYTATISTANGKVKAAPTKIERIEVGGITVYDVQAIVLPDEALNVNLLGVSFLSRLKRYEYAGGRMVLEQ
jgi:aspartyl protease family protein